MERKGAPSRGQRTLRVEGASEDSAHINARGRLWAAELCPDVPRFSVTVFVLTRLMTYGLSPWRDPSPRSAAGTARACPASCAPGSCLLVRPFMYVSHLVFLIIIICFSELRVVHQTSSLP